MRAIHFARQQASSPAVPRRSVRTLTAKGSEKRSGSHRQDAKFRGPTYHSGEVVQQSGIYEAVHEAAHRDPHDVVMIEGDLFPPCDTCSHRVRFRLVRTAPYIFTDEDFEKPK
jgi:hypothetical protein